MKFYNVIVVLVLATLVSCGGSDKKKSPSYSVKPKKPVKVVKASEIVDLNDKGVGPIKSVDISKPVDKAMADKGAELFKSKCTACHKTSKKFIGPSPTGVLKRRSPEWVMNMIMNPEVMVEKNKIAKQLLVDFNGSPMANQNVKKDEARAIVEYFRTLN